MRRAPGVAVAALTVAAFSLRLAGIDQSLFGDELYTYRIATENSLWGIFGDVAHSTETNPPLHYLLAWLAVQAGDPTISIRLPSLILGTATVPLVYALGLRAVGRRAALVGAALMAISPFAIFYSVENRAYGTLTFLSALSTLLLLRALRQGRSLPWLAYGVTAAAVLYTHYTGVFVVLGQFGWALWTHRAQVRQLALVHAAIALAYVPWLPSLFNQRELASVQAKGFASRFPLSAETIADMVARVLPGFAEPSFLSLPLRQLPGRPVVAIVWGTIGVALVASIVRVWRRHRAGRPLAPSAASALIVVLVLVTPIGLVLYSVQPDTSWLLARNLSASLPAFALLLGWLLTSLQPRFAIAAVGLVLAALAVGAAKTLDDDNQRPPYRQVAHFIDNAAAAMDAVVQPGPCSSVAAVIRPLTPHLKRAREVLWTGEDDLQNWRRAALARRVFVVVPRPWSWAVGTWALGAPQSISRPAYLYRSRLGVRFSLEAHHVYRGLIPVAVFEYKRAGGPAAGTDDDLIGRRTDLLRAARPVNAEAYLDAPEAFRTVDPRASSVPAVVAGWLAGSSPEGQRIAIAINGRIRAVTITYRQNGEMRFAGMVPRSAYRPGANSVEVFAIRGKRRTRRLVTLTSDASEGARLVSRDRHRVVVLPSGRHIDVAGRSVSGYVERLAALGGRLLVVGGWAADTVRRRVADQVLVFADGRLLAARPPTKDRPDIGLKFGRRLKRSGYLLIAQTDQAEQLAAPSRIRVIALSGNRASELKALKGSASDK